MNGWLTTTLIFLPVAAGVVLWALPLPRYWVGSLALLAALTEVGLWIDTLVAFDFEERGLQFEQQGSWSRTTSGSTRSRSGSSA